MGRTNNDGVESAWVEVRRECLGEQAMVDLGVALGHYCSQGMVIYLNGELGMGKTTLCRGVLQAFGHIGAVKSPTYTLVEPYQLGPTIIYHFDLYRLGEPEELEYMGIRDYFSQEGLCLIEWPQKGAGVLAAADIVVDITAIKQGRNVSLRAETPLGKQTLMGLLL